MSLLPSLKDEYRAWVFGASGGIGAAFVRALAADPRCSSVHAGARDPDTVAKGPGINAFGFDLLDEASIAAAVETAIVAGPPDLVLVATGVLHGQGLAPEKSLRALDAAALAQAMALNAIGPALIAKHALPRLAKGTKAVCAALSARVGSIADNRTGGWHGYRASKAALNQLMRTCAIETAHRNPHAIVATLHPGTVDTAMSKPFQAGVVPSRLFTPDASAGHLLAVIDTLSPADTGGFFAWDAQPIPF
jgi:NAD(P)-dependent dehydrogenase (short-subunit alcohol dehydrogenase family)